MLDPAVNNCSDLQEEVIPLPALADDEDDKRVLIDQQRTDDTQVECRQKADSHDKGYSWKDELLVHTGEDVLGQTTTQIVLPVDRRKTVLEMAHSSLLGGHLGTKKTKAMVNRHFTWPGLGKDVATWCKACERCQLTAKHSSKVAPLHPLPVITEPFHKLAFDLVVTLPRTKRGHKFILTTMDYGTKFPDAVPLRKVDAETVATAMVDIFSRYGLPREILTDQGTVFTSSLMCQLWQLLQITRVKTSPYHPQTDGMLERWHATLKGMLRKTRDLGKEWDDLLSYCLFVYRSAPHTNTGIAPFELLFGRNKRGPLEVLKSGWMGGEIAEKSIVGWVAVLKKKLQATAARVEQKELEAKARMKKSYNKQATLISFKPGDMVLMRIPQLQAKLQDT